LIVCCDEPASVLQSWSFKARNAYVGHAEHWGVLSILTWGRWYDNNFLRFSTIFGEKIGVFLKYQCYDQFFQNLALFRVKNAIFFADFFGENI
jgi:hypothetical protein